MSVSPGRFYAYVHKAPDGTVFYVGKGTGDRAHSKDRQPEWYYYVNQILGGQHTVEIVQDKISEEDALRLEDALLRTHAATVINLQNMYSPVDSPKIIAYSNTIRECDNTLRLARQLEKDGKLAQALELYEKAYQHYGKAMSLRDYNLGARRLLPPNRWASTQISDNYSKCLAKAGRHADVVAFSERYFADYGAGDTKIEVALKKRAEKSRGKI